MLRSAESLTEGSLAKMPDPAVASQQSVESLRQAVCAALDQGGHASAGQLLGAGIWSLDGATLRIETAMMGRKMLSLTINAAADKIIREALASRGGPARFLVIPGENGGATAQTPAPIAARGSIQEAALNHPLVQRAREILKAEVRSVVDLREK